MSCVFQKASPKKTKRELSPFIYMNKVDNKRNRHARKISQMCSKVTLIKTLRRTSNEHIRRYLTPSPIAFIVDSEHVNAR